MDDFGSRRDSGSRGSGESYPREMQKPSAARRRGADIYADDRRGDNYNEYSYEPPKKRKNSGKGLNIALIVLCVCAIGISSVVGISLIRDVISDGDDKVAAVSSEQPKVAPPVEKSSTEQVVKAEDSTPSEEVPVIETTPTPAQTMEIPDIVTKTSPSVVGISSISGTTSSSGTGIIMSEDGYVITNAHVVSGATAISVVVTDRTADGDSSSGSAAEDLLNNNSESSGNENFIPAQLVGIDEQTDLAVLKIEKEGLVGAEFGSSSDIKVGELAIVIGNPLGFELANTVTSGIISATERTLTIKDRSMTFIQTDATINPGNSGGPLINAYGQVIGITSAKVSSEYGEGLGFAIPIDEAQPIIYDLIQYGYVKGRPTLGISGKDIDAFYANYYGIPRGFVVMKAESGGAADRAGIRVNDIIMGIDGELITTMKEFNRIKDRHKAGETITVSVFRDRNDIRDIEVTLDEATSDSDNDTTESHNNGSERGSTYNYYNDYEDFFDNFPF